jgi:hypothetical protein
MGYFVSLGVFAWFFAVFFIVLIPGIFYLITLQNTLGTVSPENRKMAPTNVWLLLIPGFNIFWLFFVVDALATSLKQEYEKYGVFTGERPTFGIGLAMAILQVCSWFISFGGVASFVCWVLHWVKVNDSKNEIIILQQNARLNDGEKSIFL